VLSVLGVIAWALQRVHEDIIAARACAAARVDVSETVEIKLAIGAAEISMIVRRA
jgi:hypothetical protein